MITREQAADLRAGDIVELRYDDAPDTVTRGPLRTASDGSLNLARTVVRTTDGECWNGHLRLLTIVSRAPRPLYVNHPRTEPKYGDVVADKDGDAWQYRNGRWCLAQERALGVADISDCAPLRLLVDGDTGQVVQ